MAKLPDADPNDEAEKLAKTYLQALAWEKKGLKLKACNLFKDLSTEPALPIKEAALVHTLMNCPLNKSELKEIWANQHIPAYLQESYLQYSLELAAGLDLEDEEAQFSIELIPFKKTQVEKLKLIKRALHLAEKKNDKTQIKRCIEKLKTISPQYQEEINDDNIFSVAKDLEVNRKFDSARELYWKIINGEFSLADKVKAFNSYRTSYKIQRDLKSFLVKTFEMESFLHKLKQQNPHDLKTIEAWAEAKIALARAVWTDHQNIKARKILDELLKSKLGNDNQKALAHYVYGSLYIENKENQKALKQYRLAANFKITDSSLDENIQWAIVWNFYLLKKYAEVLSSADKFLKKSTNPNFMAKLNFWKAKSLLKIKKVAEANSLLKKLMESDEFGYYGIISRIELAAAFAPLTRQEFEKQNTGYMTFDWLLALDEVEFSQKYLKEIDSQFKTYAQREKAMPLYFFTQWFQGGMRQIYNFKPSSRQALTQKYIDVIFPKAFLSNVQKANQKYGVPSELIWAIIRQESAFVASERSWADAFGLMQLIPEKAHQFSAKYKIPFKGVNDLYNPGINIEMGSALLKELRQHYDGKFAQTVAAYNASEEAIATWEKERFNGDYLEFIEMIPYEETRNYIKLVFRNFITYKRLNSRMDFKMDKNFFSQPF